MDQVLIVTEAGMANKGVPGSRRILGFDVSKGWIDVAEVDTAEIDAAASISAGGGRVWRIANEAAAIAAFLAAAGPVALAAFEPTGGYERALRHALAAAGIAFARVHPNEIVAFRARRGVKAKTDRIDARLIAAFAATEIDRRGLAPLVEGEPALREMVARRRQLADALHAERCRLALAHAPPVRDSLAAVVAALQAALKTLEAEILAHLEARPDLADTARRLRGLTGVGPITVMTLIADLPELGRLSAKQIASLAGLAPRTRSSGRRTWRATTGHGRPAVRRVLFNAARCAIRHNQPMKAFYQRLVTQNRRPGKVALVAVMRKMLVVLNAIARDKTDWNGAKPA